MKRLVHFVASLLLVMMPVQGIALDIVDFTNAANVSSSSSEFELNFSNNDSSQVVLPKGLLITKIANSSGLSTPPMAGELIVYTITAENIGLLDLTNVNITDTIIPAANISLISGDLDLDNEIDADETWVYEGIYPLTQLDLDTNGGGDGDIDNTVVLTTDEIANAQDSVEVSITQAPAYSVDKTQTSGPNPATTAGDLLNYTITLVNTGNLTLTNINPSDTLPDGLNGVLSGPSETQSINGVFEPGEIWTYTISYTVSQTDINTLTSVTNTVSVVTDQLPTPQDSSAVTVILARGSVGDRVWHDLNGDGVQDSGEFGIAGILVELLDDANNVVDSQASNANGNYLFTDVIPEDYRVRFSLPNGYLFSDVDQTGDDNDSDANPFNGETPLFTLVGDAAISNLDAGMVIPGSIGDRVWLDADGDGLQDADEDPIPNVTLTLFDGINQIAQVITGNDGQYQFDELKPGDYRVVVDPISLPANLSQTYDENGPLDNDSGVITIISSQNHATADFGYQFDTSVNGNIGDIVWTDQNQNGIHDPGEIPIVGALVGLYQGQTQITTTLTDENGQYLFTNLPAGDYRVVINPDTIGYGRPPAGYIKHPLGDPDVKDQITTIANNETTISLSANESFTDADFGFHLPDAEVVRLGDTIFEDLLGDGVLNGSDAGIASVSVALYNDATNNLIATVFTDNNGSYEFVGLHSNQTYRVVVQDTNGVLTGMQQTAMPNNSVNGGQLGNSGNENVVLISNNSNLNQDFGYQENSISGGDGVIGDSVFFDMNANNTMDDGEGISDVTVTLWNISGPVEFVVATELTDENGKYIFTGLDNTSQYRVVVNTNSLPNAGVGWQNTVDPDALLDGMTNLNLSPASPVYLGGDFGYMGAQDGEITGTIWDDENEDGHLSPNESRRFAGVTVELRDNTGALIAVTKTASNGEYLFDNLPFGMYMVIVTDVANITSGYSHTDGASDTDNNSQNDQGYEVLLSAVNRVDSTGDFGYRSNISTPITLASFVAINGHSPGQVYFKWTTATEVGNVGFRLFAKVTNTWLEVNHALIPASGDSVELQSYEFSADGLHNATEFVLVDVDIYGDQVLHGVFKLGQTHGIEPSGDQSNLSGAFKDALPFPALKSKPDEATRQQRQQREKDQHRNKLDRLLNRPLSSLGAWLLNALVNQAEATSIFTLADINVEQTGVYEINNSDLLAAEIDLQGLEISRLGLSSQGEAIPLEVLDNGDGLFNQGDVLRFLGKAIDTLYTDTNVYKLEFDGSTARIQTNASPIPAGPSAPYYINTVSYAPQNTYALTSPTGDPWFADKLLATNLPATKSINLPTSNYISSAVAPVLSVKLWGGSDLPSDTPNDPDHHVLFDVNGTRVGEILFNGIQAVDFSTPLGISPADSSVAIDISLPNDIGYVFDLVNLESVSLAYPSAFVAENNFLSFKSHWPKYRIGGFNSPNINVYAKLQSGEVQKFDHVLSGGDCSINVASCQAIFAGLVGDAEYFAVSTEGLLSPVVTSPIQSHLITTNAETIVIAHPDFIALPDNALEQYVAELQTTMNNATLIDVRQIYAAYSDGNVNAKSIHAYIKDQYALGTQQVLLVGGDNYDYKQYSSESTQSLIPSLYAQTDDTIRFSPVDPKYGDVDGDSVPDIIVARLPVQTPLELRQLLNKRTTYNSRNYHQTAIFAADAYGVVEQYSFSEDADTAIAQNFGDWAITKAYIDTLGSAQAKLTIQNAINAGTSLFVYTGHSSNDRLSFHNLFSGEDAAALTNHNKPTVVTQWGCWNSYNVEPTQISMVDQLLLSGEQGAVSVLGTSTLTDATAERTLANLFYAELAKGKTLGAALLDAKTKFALTHPNQIDLLLGVTIMGFPEVVVYPQ